MMQGSAAMMGTHGPLGIEFISVFGLPPVAFVELAKDLGAGAIGLMLEPNFPNNPHGYPPWSLRQDATLRRDLAKALKDSGVHIALGEGFLIRAGADIAASAADLDLMAEIGAQRVNVITIEPDLARSQDQCAHFAQMAHARGMASTLEFLPGMRVGDLATALEVVQAAGAPGFGLLLDAMHVFRSGASARDVAALDPALVGYAQLCDVPRASPYPDYAYEARWERRPPSLGELPLADFIAALPPHCPIGLELPMLSAAEAGVGPRERLAPAVAASLALLSSAGS